MMDIADYSVCQAIRGVDLLPEKKKKKNTFSQVNWGENIFQKYLGAHFYLSLSLSAKLVFFFAVRLPVSGLIWNLKVA